jgi:hypothetical protein
MRNNFKTLNLAVAGWALLAIGMAAAVFGFFKSGAAEYSETLNIGLLTDKTNMVLAGGFMATIGAIFYATHVIASAVRMDVKDVIADPARAEGEK